MGYTYERLPTATSIRVLELLPQIEGQPRRARLVAVDLADHPEYDCLSYVWGDGTNPGTCICDDQEISITRNLADFLEVYKVDSASPRCLWVDSICINQNDIAEVTQQVKMMDRVYYDAKCVHVWLGSHDTYLNMKMLAQGIDLLASYASPVAISGFFARITHLLDHLGHIQISLTDILQVFYRAQGARPISWTGSEDEAVACMLEFTKFLSHPWFTRAWTFQESRLARERRIHFGHETCRNQRMRLAIGVLDILFDLASVRLISDIDSSADTNPEIAKVARITERADLMMDPMSSHGKSDHIRERAPLINLLNTRRGASCGRPQDVVFSLLGLVRPEDRITVDYEKPLSQLFYEIARRSLETSSDLEILAFPCAHSR